MKDNPTFTQRPIQSGALLGALILAMALAALAFRNGTGRLVLACGIGLFAGVALYHAAFGFTAAWSRFIVEARGAGLRAQFLLILLTAAITFPLLEQGELFGRPLYGSVAPFGYAAALGAFIFGIGMQFGGSCASGTLFTAGGGNTRMLVTLTGFIAGSVIATAHLPFWWSLPTLPRYSIVESFGAVGAFGLTASVLALIAVFSITRERKAHGSIESPLSRPHPITGPWTKSAGAVALAVVSIATLLTLSRPWGITSAFTLWGAKIARSVGVDIEQWEYWSQRTEWLNQSIFADATSVMNFGIIVGALIAASLAGRFAPKARVRPRAFMLALMSGLLMGYGARLAYGCNIGAYLGGVISGSLHGWGWLVFGFLGSVVGLKAKSALE